MKENIITIDEKLIHECIDIYLRKYLKENAKLPLYETINNFDAPLYHNTSMENLINMMSTNSMSSTKHRGYREGQTHNGICFTRKKKYNPYSDYNVKLTIDTRQLFAVSRGLKLIPYKDSQHQNVNEFEERLVSKSGDDFTLKNFNEYVTDITINLKPIEIKLMNGRGKSAFAYISELRHIFQYKLFRDRIKIIKDSNNNEAVSLENAVSYLEGYDDGLDADLFESKNSINYNSRNNQIPKFLYHATPSCYLSSIKKNGLGGKIPRRRFWDYNNTEYVDIEKGCFLATDEYVAESYLEASEEFEYFSEWYEERYGKELDIVVFKIPTSNLDIKQLKIDTNQLIDDETEATYFYDGVIPYNQMSIIQLY